MKLTAILLMATGALAAPLIERQVSASAPIGIPPFPTGPRPSGPKPTPPSLPTGGPSFPTGAPPAFPSFSGGAPPFPTGGFPGFPSFSGGVPPAPTGGLPGRPSGGPRPSRSVPGFSPVPMPTPVRPPM